MLGQLWPSEWTDEQLRQSLPDGVTLAALRAGLAEEARKHHMREVEQGPGRDIMIKQLAGIRGAFDAVVGALEAADPRVRLLLGYGSPWASGAPQIEALRAERDNAERMGRLLETGAKIMIDRGTKIPGKTELSTYLCRGLRNLYVDLTGKTEIGNDKGGPLHRHARLWAALIDPEFPFPEPAAFRLAVRRGTKRVDT
jgi:hypothetical protein